MTSPPACPLDSFPQIKSRKQPYDPTEMTELEKEAATIVARLEAHSTLMADAVAQRTAQEAKLKSYNDLVYAKNLGELEQLKPGNTNKVNELMATLFNQKADNLGVNPFKYSREGNVWYQLQQMRRIASGMIEAKARWEGTFQVKQMMRDLDNIIGKRPMPFGDKNELVQRLVEVGQIPEQRATFQVGPAGDAFNRARYQELVDTLKDNNFTDTQIQQMISKATSISQVMDEVRAYAKGFGVDTGKNVEGIGYWARLLTGDAKQFMYRAKETNSLYDQLVKPANPINALTQIVKDRETFHYIPESESLLAYSLGVHPDKLREMLADGKQFVAFLHKETTPAELEKLVQTGLLSKVPMTTPEIFNYVRDQYKTMPFRNMSEMFKTNPFDVLDFYRHELEREAGRSAQVKNFFKEGIKSGWVAAPQDVSANRREYKDFVKLAAKDIKDLIPDFKGALGDDVYVHPTAWNMLKAQLDIARSPEKLNTLATTLSYFAKPVLDTARFLNQSLLIDPRYPMRILYSNLIASQAAGANMLRHPEGMFDLMKLNQIGLSALDNTKAIYEITPGQLVTKQQLFKDVFVVNRSHDILPQTVTNLTGRIKFNALNPQNLPRAIGYVASYAKRYGAMEAAGYAGSMLTHLQSEVYGPLAALAMYFENSTKWATLLSLTDKSAANRIGQFVTTIQAPHFNHASDTLKYLDEYFHTWDDVGSVTKTTTEYIKPFAQFAMNNPMMQLRHAIRNPAAYMNYWRIRTMLNGGPANDPDMINGAVPQYINDGGPMTLFKSDGKWVTFLTTGADPIFEGNAFLEKGAAGLAHTTLGWWEGASEEQRQELRDHYAGNTLMKQFFIDLFKDTMPLYQEAVSQLTGQDVRTGRPIEQQPGDVDKSFLGMNMSRPVKHLLSIYGPAKKLDDINPFDMFGTPEVRDPRTNQIVRPGTPSIFGQQRSPDSQTELYDPGVSQDWRIRLLKYAGLQPKLIDYARGVQYTYSDIDLLSKQAVAQINKITKNVRFRTDMSEGEREQKKQELSDIIEQYGQLEIDRARITAYMRQHNIPPKEAFEKLEERGNKQLGPLDPQAIQKVLDTIKEMRSQAGILRDGTNVRPARSVPNQELPGR